MKKNLLPFLILLFGLFNACNADELVKNSYSRIKPVIPTESGDKIEVVEIFWYGCPHCHEFEPYIEKWLKDLPKDVEFRRIPAALNQNWIAHARAYYTAEKLGVVGKIHSGLFDAIHRQGKKIYTEEQLKDFFISQGIDGDLFTKTYTSQEVEIKVKQAIMLARRARITGVPAIIVNGKYLTSGSAAGSYNNLLKIINQLVDIERGEL